MSNSESPELHSEFHRYAYYHLFHGFAEHLHPVTGVLDLRTGAGTLDSIDSKLTQLGIPREHIQVMAASALQDVIHMNGSLRASGGPEELNA